MAHLRTVLSPRVCSGIYVLVGMIIAFSLIEPSTFPTAFTAKSLAREQAVTAIVALGLLVAVAGGLYDLSVGGVVGVAAVLSSYLMAEADVSPVVAVLCTVAGGLFVGLCNGVLVVYAKIDSFIATLATGTILGGIVTLISGNQNITGIPFSFGEVGLAEPLGIPIAAIYMLVLAFVLWALLQHTPLGRYIYAAGANTEIARLAGVRTDGIRVACLVFSATTASIGGVIITAQVGAGSPDIGPPYLLPVFAAVFLGATQFFPGRVNVWGTVVGVFVLATGVRGLELMGVPLWVSPVFNGFALILAVGLSNFEARRFRWWPSRRKVDGDLASVDDGRRAEGAS